MKFKLEEKLWRYTIPSKYGQDIVEAEDGQDADGIVAGLKDLVAFIKSDIIRDNADMEADFEDIEETVNEIDASDFEDEDYDEVDNILNDIYDFCDLYSVWFEPGI